MFYNCFGEQMKDKRQKVIIDTDPGVDDCYALIFMLFDPSLDIELITTVAGNLGLDKTTRNLLHLLDKFGIKNIPVAKGAARPLCRISQDATFIHQKEGMGGYIPPKKVKGNILKDNAVEAMYQVIKNNPGEIVPILMGPHTNFAKLLMAHPDVKDLVPRIIYEGGSPYGAPGFPDHISFNMSYDPEAFQVVLNSRIPLTLIPSNIGRRKAHLEEKMVYEIKNQNEVGEFIFQMFDKYWEPGFDDKRIATNDICTYMYLRYPKLFKFLTADFMIDLEDMPGKTTGVFHKKGNIKIVCDVKRKKFLKIIMQKLKQFDNFKLN